MPRARLSQDPTVLTMALVGYEIEKQKIEQKIKEIRAQLGIRRAPAPAGKAEAAEEPQRRKLSVAARKRIAVAQRRRWAEHRKKQAQVAKAAKS